MTKHFVLAHDTARQRACTAVAAADAGDVVTIKKPGKSRGQEEKYHAMIGDIQKSGKFYFLDRNDWSEEDIKRLLVDAFAKECAALGLPLSQSGRIVPSLDMRTTVQLGIQTRKFNKREGSDFVEYLHAYGAQIGVIFSGS